MELPALPGDDQSLRSKVPPRTVTYWRTQGLIIGVPILALVVAGAVWLDWFTPVVRWVIVAVLAVRVIGIQLLFGPPIRRRIFWYAVSENEIDLQHGLIVTKRFVIPMNRVQHLKMDHGPIADRFNVANLHIHTAAGSVPMRGLDAAEADIVRARISALAGLADDV